MAYTLKTHLANKSNYGSIRNLNTIKYIVIHYTSNDGDTDENNGKYFDNTIVQASAHYFVDDDSITQSVPDNYVAWSVGGKKYSNCATTGGGRLHGIATNANTLNIEICDDVKNGVVYPSAATIENVIAFTKAKQKEYNIPDSNVIRHFDVTGKSCPAYWVDDAKWKAEFWNKLSDDAPTENTTTPTTTPSTSTSELNTSFPATPFTVQVLVSDLNYRSTGSMSGKVKGQTGKGVFTIVEVKNGWGKLKSGAGWIYLENPKYCKIGKSTGASSQTKPSAPANTFKSYKVQVTASALNIRKGAGTNYRTNGTIRDKGVYTIVAEASGKGATKWGKLKSGAGWISLDYCKKI